MRIVKAGFDVIAPQDQAGFIIAAKQIERMGRIAYKSEDMITKDSWEHFISMIVSRGHESVLEHANMSVIFTCDRGVSHEIVRHRLCAFTQESTRYCNYSTDKFGNEIAVIEREFDNAFEESLWKHVMQTAEGCYRSMLDKGATPQMARSVLPNSLKTEIGVTANFREWRHIFRLRAISSAAHPQMREVMVPLYEHCCAMLPEVFYMGV